MDYTGLHSRIRNAVQEHLKLCEADKYVVDFVSSLIIANAPWALTDMAWANITGASGTAKTEILRMYSGICNAFPLDNVTDKTFISGYIDPNNPEKDHSLLAQMDKKMVFCRDFSAIMSNHPYVAAAILSDLRIIHDDQPVSKAFGTGHKVVKARFGWLGAVTPEIDHFTRSFSALGERMLMFRFAPHVNADHSKRLRHIWDQKHDKDRWRKVLLDIMTETLDPILGWKESPSLPMPSSEQIDRLCSASAVAALGRSLPRKKGNVIEPEMGSRIIQGSGLIAQSRALMEERDTWNDLDLYLALRVVRDTLPREAGWLLEVLYRSEGKDIALHAICQRSRLPSEFVLPIMDQWLHSGLVTKSQSGGWGISTVFIKEIKFSGLFLPPPKRKDEGRLTTLDGPRVRVFLPKGKRHAVKTSRRK